MGLGSSHLSNEETKGLHVVVIGGGYGGIKCALQLQKFGIPFTLVDPKEFFHHNVGALRSAVYPGKIWVRKDKVESLSQSPLAQNTPRKQLFHSTRPLETDSSKAWSPKLTMSKRKSR